MGQKYHFHCTNCGYTAEVSGGKDCGFIATVRTMVCTACKELVDVLIGMQGNEYETLTEFKRIVASGKSSENIIEGFRKCPKCNKDKFLQNWNPIKRPCPRCGNKMDRDDSKTIMWD